MLTALVEGEADPEMLAELAKGKLRLKRAALEQALSGRVRDHHRFLLAQHLTHLDFLDEQIEVFSHQIARSIHTEDVSGSGPPQSAMKIDGSETAKAAGEGLEGERPLGWDAAVELLDT